MIIINKHPLELYINLFVLFLGYVVHAQHYSSKQKLMPWHMLVMLMPMTSTIAIQSLTISCDELGLHFAQYETTFMEVKQRMKWNQR